MEKRSGATPASAASVRGLRTREELEKGGAQQRFHDLRESAHELEQRFEAELEPAQVELAEEAQDFVDVDAEAELVRVW